MFVSSETEPQIEGGSRRVIGRYGGQAPGSLIVCIGGIHGNEPAGVVALRRVLRRLQAAALPFRGQILALSGNVRALNRGRRYEDRDLNRMWLPERVRAIRAEAGNEPADYEDREQRELLGEIDAALAARSGDAVFLDLHTTSSAGAPFAVISDTLINRRFAFQLRVPVILGLEENIDGTILNYINELGHAAIGFEAGQHDALSSVRHHEAAIWTTLIVAGCLDPGQVPDFAGMRAGLAEAAAGLPAVLELRYRHAITAADEFLMQPGFRNFQAVRRGALLARDQRGLVLARESGFLFMPLYQSQGDDGFFLIRRVKPFWLRMAAWLRRRRAERILHLLPGVHRRRELPDSLIINTRIARWFVLEICHLMGFRKHAQSAGQLIVTRRRQTPAVAGPGT